MSVPGTAFIPFTPAPHAARRRIRPGRFVLGCALLAGACLGAEHLAHAGQASAGVALPPLAGIALGALLARGWRCWPGVFLGALLTGITTAPPGAGAGTGLAAILAAGATLQALVAVGLIRHLTGGYSRRAERPRDVVALLLLGGPVASLIAPACALALAAAGGPLTPETSISVALNAWAGNTLSVLLFAPTVLLALTARTPQAWRRTAAVGAPLLVTAVAAVATIDFAGTIEQRRLRAEVERLASVVTSSIEAQVAAYGGATLALSGLFEVTPATGRETFAVATAPLLERYPAVRGVEWVPRVPAARLPVHEERARDFGRRAGVRALADYRVGELGPDGALVAAAPREEYFPVYYLEPLSAGFTLLGLDLGSHPERSQALQQAGATGQVVASAPVDLAQDDAELLFIAPVYAGRGDPKRIAARRDELRGFVLSAVSTAALFAARTSAEALRSVHLRVEDTTGLAERPTVYANSSTATPRGRDTFVATRSIGVGGRLWRLRIWPTAELSDEVQRWTPLVALLGWLLFGSAMSTFLLLMSGRLSQVHLLVGERTRALERSTAALERSNAELLRSNAELDKFAYVASHDLKAPLRAIRQISTWIGKDATDVLPPRSRRHLQQLTGRVERMDGLLDGLLQYARAGRERSECSTIDLNGLLRDVVELLALPAGFEARIQPGLPVIRGYRPPLFQVLQNLIGNAVKHHDRDSGCIEVNCRLQGALIEFVVRDDGPGIDPAYHERVFGLFQTLRPRDEVEGSGMGLAVVKRVIDNHGGTVWLESDGGRGTAVHFTWPREVRGDYTGNTGEHRAIP